MDAEICSFARALRNDVDAALACDVDSVHLVVPTSDIHLKHKLKKSRREIKRVSLNTARYALDHGLVVEFSAEDATRTDPTFLREFLSAAVNEGVQRVCICDTVGVLTTKKASEYASMRIFDAAINPKSAIAALT